MLFHVSFHNKVSTGDFFFPADFNFKISFYQNLFLPHKAISLNMFNLIMPLSIKKKKKVLSVSQGKQGRSSFLFLVLRKAAFIALIPVT